MLYQNYLKKLKKCPFCNLKKEEILKSNKSALLILAKAPYTNDHLLVIPKKHLKKINSLTKKEKIDLENLEFYGIKKLHKKHKNVSVLYREGNKKEVGKSINHLHIHLIPKIQIGSITLNAKKRKIYSEEDYIEKIKELKKIF